LAELQLIQGSAVTYLSDLPVEDAPAWKRP
jgi:hypothetical protein